MSPETEFERLDSEVRGEVLLPGEEGYDDARTLWNDMIEKRPTGRT